jgi:hypothetical protein
MVKGDGKTLWHQHIEETSEGLLRMKGSKSKHADLKAFVTYYSDAQKCQKALDLPLKFLEQSRP